MYTCTHTYLLYINRERERGWLEFFFGFHNQDLGMKESLKVLGGIMFMSYETPQTPLKSETILSCN